MEILSGIVITIFGLIGLKAIIIGSDFSFYKWIKYGKKYVKEYNNWLKLKP
jgi:hypothetical protein